MKILTLFLVDRNFEKSVFDWPFVSSDRRHLNTKVLKIKTSFLKFRKNEKFTKSAMFEIF